MKYIGWLMIFGYYIYFMAMALTGGLGYLLLAIFMPPVAWLIAVFAQFPASILDVLWIMVGFYFAGRDE